MKLIIIGVIFIIFICYGEYDSKWVLKSTIKRKHDNNIKRKYLYLIKKLVYKIVHIHIKLFHL